MNSFTVELSITPIDALGKLWRVNNAFKWHLDTKHSEWFVPVEKGFVYDLASVPKLVRWLVPHTIAPQASALHDKLYRDPQAFFKGYGEGTCSNMISLASKLTRKECDTQFYLALKAKGVGDKKAWMAYQGVRAGGWMAWNKHRKKDTFIG